MKNLLFIFLTLLISSKSFAETDARVALDQINQEILVSLRGAVNEIAIEKSGAHSSDVEMCSSVAVGLNSAKLAKDITGLKELKKIRVVSKQGAITEFLDFSEGDKGSVVGVVSVDQLTKNLQEFYKKNCIETNVKDNGNSSFCSSKTATKLTVAQNERDFIMGDKNSQEKYSMFVAKLDNELASLCKKNIPATEIADRMLKTCQDYPAKIQWESKWDVEQAQKKCYQGWEAVYGYVEGSAKTQANSGSKADCDGVVKNGKRLNVSKDISDQADKIQEVLKSDKNTIQR